MASPALRTWRTASSKRLDDLLDAHASLRGTTRGRRYATAQIDAALVVQALLAGTRLTLAWARGVFAGHEVVRVRLGDSEDPEAREFEVPANELEPAPAAAA